MKRLPDFLRHPRLPAALAIFAALALGIATFEADAGGGIADAQDIALLAAVLAIWLTCSLLDWQLLQRHFRWMKSFLLSGWRQNRHFNARNDEQTVSDLRARMRAAVDRIRASRLAEDSRRDALYALPWVLMIGSAGAGKSAAILHSGLDFPLAERSDNALQCIPPTQDCEWHFTKQGIVLDTAGAFMQEPAREHAWFAFLASLRKCRPQLPVNGIVVTVSIAGFLDVGAEAAVTEAKQLRQRVQDLMERLEVMPPVYVMFTKMDRLAGFQDFFAHIAPIGRGRVWGATMACGAQAEQENAAALFERHFSRLLAGLTEQGKSILSTHRDGAPSPGLLALPLELAALGPALRAFVGTLFDDNPFQIRPVFRGFYFTSALPQDAPRHHATSRLARQFGLALPAHGAMTGRAHAGGGPHPADLHGYFIRELFTSVIFPDRDSARSYLAGPRLASRRVVFHAAVLMLGLALGGWTWSAMANRQYVANIRADLDKAVKLQQGRPDFAARLEALLILQDRLEQLQRYRRDKPWALGFGLYQGDTAERRLRAAYFAGLRQLMLAPVTASLENTLAKVNAGAAAAAAAAAATPFDATHGQGMPNMPGASALSVASTASAASESATVTGSRSPYARLADVSGDDAYNALKTYLMLAQRERFDPGHLSDQITRFWRDWLESRRGDAPHEQTMRGAERLIRFYLSQYAEADLPMIENRIALVDETRETLRRQARATPPAVRVYQEIKARAATRFPAVTIAGILGEQDAALITGSHAIPGTFTREAWEKFVEGAIREASTRESRSEDWVLKTSTREDLSLSGSPEQIRKELTQMYKEDYIQQWQKFMQGIAIKEFPSFDEAVNAMNRLGDPLSSPLRHLVRHLHRETAWDDPAFPAHRSVARAGNDLLAWMSNAVKRVVSDPDPVALPAGEKLAAEGGTAEAASPEVAANPASRRGRIASAFNAVERLVTERGEAKNGSLLNGYLDHLARLRTRLNQIRIAGDPGPASRQLMQATFDGAGSELTDALKHVDDAMLAGTSDGERSMLRPLLVRPLMQAFAVLVQPAEQELNRTWQAQVMQPYREGIATQSPFRPDAPEAASPAEIARIFGPDGAIARFTQTALAPLVTRRGDAVAARTWAGMGIQLHPGFIEALPRYLAATGIVDGRISAPSTMPEKTSPARRQTRFQFQPVPAAGVQEYVVEIDGQRLRYRTGPPEWKDFVWPGSQPQAGARISAALPDGRQIEIARFPGENGLEMLVNTAEKSRIGNGMHRLSWTGSGYKFAVNFRLIADMPAAADAPSVTFSDKATRFRLPEIITLERAGK